MIERVGAGGAEVCACAEVSTANAPAAVEQPASGIAMPPAEPIGKVTVMTPEVPTPPVPSQRAGHAPETGFTIFVQVYGVPNVSVIDVAVPEAMA